MTHAQAAASTHRSRQCRARKRAHLMLDHASVPSESFVDDENMMDSEDAGDDSDVNSEDNLNRVDNVGDEAVREGAGLLEVRNEQLDDHANVLDSEHPQQNRNNNNINPPELVVQHLYDDDDDDGDGNDHGGGASDNEEDEDVRKLFQELKNTLLYQGAKVSCLEAVVLLQQFVLTTNLDKTSHDLLLKLTSFFLPEGHQL